MKIQSFFILAAFFFWTSFLCSCKTIPPVHPPRIQKVQLDEDQKYLESRLINVVDALYEADTLETTQDEEKYLKHLLTLNPNNISLFWRMARVYQWYFENEPLPRRREKWAQKTMDYGGKGVFLNPKSGPCHYYYAIGLGLYLQLHATTAIKGLPKLIEHARLAVKYSPNFDFAGPHRLLGRVYLEAPSHLGGDIDLALDHLKKAVEIAPDLAENLLALGKAYWEDEEFDLAKKYFLQIYKKNDFRDFPRQLRKIKKEALEKLLELDNHYGEYYISLAEICIKLGEKERARELLETFFSLKNLKDSPKIQDQLRQKGRKLLESL